MQRVVILGRGGAGKSTFARALGRQTGPPVYELDKHFWQPGLLPLSPAEWREVQTRLVAEPRWVLDGDLGPYDVLEARLPAADTVILLNYPFHKCAWRAVRRSREPREFWLWVWHYRRRHRGAVLQAIHRQAVGCSSCSVGAPSFFRTSGCGGTRCYRSVIEPL